MESKYRVHPGEIVRSALEVSGLGVGELTVTLGGHSYRLDEPQAQPFLRALADRVSDKLSKQRDQRLRDVNLITAACAFDGGE